MQKHTTSHLENKNRKILSVGCRWLGGRSLHTTKSIAQILVGIVIMSHLYDFFAGLVACRLNFFMSAVARRPGIPRLWSFFCAWLL